MVNKLQTTENSNEMDTPAPRATTMPATVPALGVVDPLTPYNSSRLYKDVKTLAAHYPSVLSLGSIGKSVLGKDIPLLRLGCGKRPVLWTGAVHAREVVTSAYLLLAAEEIANAYGNCTAYGSAPVEKVRWLLDEFTVTIVPMANPDGVDIVTANGSAKVRIANRSTWKSNANGVNLNRNFPFDWANARNDVSRDNYIHYKGPSEGSEPETKNLIALCRANAFEHVINCHAQGRILYWRDNKNGVITGDEALARKISQIIGYAMMPSTTVAVDGWAGGFENWFRYQYKRPGICLEFCRFNTADKATMAKFYTTDMVNWAKSKNLILGVLDSLSNLKATPTTSAVYVNGKKIAFDAYNICGNNYFKLRDLAFALSGTKKQFDVEWDGKNILLKSGRPYTPVGGEMTGKGSDVKKPAPTSSAILLDGRKIYVKACLIGGNNYFKLRDTGQLFDFNVTWVGADNAILINTNESYTDD